MTDNKNIFTNNKKSDSQNVKDNLLIDELDTYSDYVHEFSDSYKNRKEEFLMKKKQWISSGLFLK